MSRRLSIIAALVLLAACAAPAPETPAPESSAQAQYDRFARDYLDWYYAENPVRSTALGLHEYDAELPAMDRTAIERQAEALRGWLDRLQSIDRDALEGDAYWDYRILDYAIRDDLLELEEERGWARSPSSYNSVLAGALSSIAFRQFAPLEERIASMIARMEQFPEITAAARANLDPAEVPPIYAESGLRNTRGTVAFLRDNLPAALRAQGFDDLDPALRDAWRAAHTAALDEVERYADWLETEIVPNAAGDFRLGADLFERKLRYEEHVDLSVEELDRMNEAAIRDYKDWVARVSAEIDPTRTPGAIMDSLTGVHPSPEELIPTARGYIEDAQRFVLEHDIVTLPSMDLPTVRETPEYARWGFASMDTPGPFEDVATEAYYNITNVDPDWTEEQKQQHLTYFNYPGLLGITVHEAMPGHFVQLLYEQQIPTEVRKVFTPASLVEGWAHYAEQMMVDEGLGGGDPGIRLGQLRRALQRHARWYAGLHMHAFDETIENAAERYQDIAYFAPFPALREVQRGTYDPTYLYYALGRMQILELREDYREYVESQGREFSLREFHDRFLRLGLPVSLARQVMIPESGA